MNFRSNPYRIMIQLFVLLVILYLTVRLFTDKGFITDYEAYCPFGGILAFSSFLVNNSLACSMTSAQIAMGAALVLSIIAFSKLFCSYICPAGTVSEWIGKAGEKLRLRVTAMGYTDLLLRGLKYALLFITVYYSVSSSELFCRKFDPYYAAVTGFGSDVLFFWALAAIVIVMAGSFFIRLFWCRYLCPLGAASNVFMFFILFAAITGIYLVIRFAGVELSFVWPLALFCIIAYLIEFYTLKSRVFPVFRINRHPSICTNCKLCNRYCPHAIEVESVLKVKHIDCHLCGDCIQVCPEKGALTVGRKGRKWLPALIVLVLVTAGIMAGRSFEIPTLSMYWGEKEKKDTMSEYRITGYKGVKCYGSSLAFANQVKSIHGITGVTTWVKTNTVGILYNPSHTDTAEIRRLVFTTVKPGSLIE